MILCLESGAIKDVTACSFIFVCLLGFCQGFPSTVYLSSQSFKRRGHGFEASVLSLVLFSIFLSGLWFLFLICLDLNTPNNKDHKFLR